MNLLVFSFPDQPHRNIGLAIGAGEDDASFCAEFDPELHINFVGTQTFQLCNPVLKALRNKNRMPSIALVI